MQLEWHPSREKPLDCNEERSIKEMIKNQGMASAEPRGEKSSFFRDWEKGRGQFGKMVRDGFCFGEDGEG